MNANHHDGPNAPRARVGSEQFDRITKAVAASGLVLTLIAYALLGLDAGIAAFAGAIVAVLNFVVIRWVTGRAARGGTSKLGLNALMLFKTMGLLAVCWILVARVGLDSKGFMIGITALLIGMVAGTVLGPKPSSTPDEPEAGEPEVY